MSDTPPWESSSAPWETKGTPIKAPSEPAYSGVHGVVQKIGSMWPKEVTPSDIALIPAAIGGEAEALKGIETLTDAATRASPAIAHKLAESALTRGAVKVGQGALASAAGNIPYGAAVGLEHGEKGKKLEGAIGGAENYGKTAAELGALGTAATGAAGKIAAPVLNKAVQLLRKEGVMLTPGQLATEVSDPLKRMESASTSIPVVGSLIRNAQERSLETFNRAVYNRALKTVGEKLPRNIQAGREAVEYTADKIGTKFDALVPKLTLRLDHSFMQSTRDLIEESKKLPEQEQKQVENIIVGTIRPRLSANGTIKGTDFKKIDSELAHDARTYARSLNPAQKEMSRVITRMRGLLRENLERSNPRYEKELKNLNHAWSIYKRAEGASIRRTGAVGVFSPTDLSNEIKKSTTAGIFARGDANLQDLADAGVTVMPNAVSDSGTPERQHWNRLMDIMLGAGGASAATTGEILAPAVTTKAIAMGVPAVLPYTKPGMAALDWWASPGPYRYGFRRFLGQNAPRFGIAAGGYTPFSDVINSNQQ